MSSANSSLRPAWHRGNQAGRGFQPPPTVASERGRSHSMNAAAPSASGSNNSSPALEPRRDSNKFAALDDDDDVAVTLAAESLQQSTNTSLSGATKQVNSRSEALRQGLASAQRSTSMTAKQPSSGSGGRSLSELMSGVSDRAPSAGGSNRFSALRSNNVTNSNSNIESLGDGFTTQKSAVKYIRFTREKLLSMRPAPSQQLPEHLKSMEGAQIFSEEPLDPVCWDTFDAESIWAAVSRERRASGAKTVGAEPGLEGRRSSAPTGSRKDGFTGGGRWQRGVALPPPDQSRKGRDKDADDPSELWDDPVGTGAASDFSAFGGAPEDHDAENVNVFDFEKMTELTRKFEEELHGDRSRASSDAEDEEQSNARKVDPRRPLASVGTTIRSGSGDNVNVFEDFDDPSSELAEEMTEAEPAPAIKSGDENPSASSRLMAMIGVKKELDVEAKPSEEQAPELEPESEPEPPGVQSEKQPQSEQAPLPHPEPLVDPVEELKQTVSGWDLAANLNPASAVSIAIPLNPWGGPLLPVPPDPTHELELQARLREAEELERKTREAEQIRRRQEQEESQRLAAIAQQQAEERARQSISAQQQAGVQSQVELVLMERISTILENSWGRSDLMSILATLHAEDSRVIPLLSTVDSLRALMIRHPTRVALRQDPTFGGEMAVLLLTNAQWQQQQQQHQLAAQQAQVRAQQEELRQRQLEEQQKAAAAAAAAAAAVTRAQQTVAVKPGVPWYYSDPQNVIQGPFRAEEMRQWLEAGYFKGDLPVSQQPGGPFLALSTIFGDLSAAFLPQKEVADDSAAREKARLAAERSRAEAKAREEAERIARETLEREEREERERRIETKKQREREREERLVREKASVSGGTNGGNESSAQLKMMLGLSQGAAFSKTNDPQQSDSGEAEKTTEKPEGLLATLQKPSQRPAELFPQPMQQVPAAPAWGGGTTQLPKKSMSEIQQEEARAAAMMAMQKEGSRSSNSGWANVAASRGGSTGWGGNAVKRSTAVVTGSTSSPPQPALHSGAIGLPQGLVKQQPSLSSPKEQPKGSVSTSVADDFGAKMSPGFEKWCKEQILKLTGSDDLTLVAFCMTLNDPAEIRQYLSAYLGTNAQVSNFATEFISRKSGAPPKQEEWETTANAKKSRKKKPATR